MIKKRNTIEVIDTLKARTIDAWAYPDFVGIWSANKTG